MKYLYFLLLFSILFGCTPKSSKPVIVSTIYPVTYILKEITGDKIEIYTLTEPGASPHTFSPRPSAVGISESSLAMFSVSSNLDGWAASLPARVKIELISMLPKDSLNDFNMIKSNISGLVTDPHFWTDPLTVKSLINPLCQRLIDLDQKNKDYYLSNAMSFSKRLDSLNDYINKTVAKIKNNDIFLFHPSFLYFIKRYGLKYGGSAEQSPGKEPTPRYLAELINKIKISHTRSIFSEPQLTEISVKSIAQSAGVSLNLLDPLGGVKGRDNFFDLLKYNAQIFRSSLINE